MKKRLSLLGWCWVWLAMTAGAAEGPRLVCDEPTYDFGRRGDHETVAHTFTLRNAGDQAVRIEQVRASCGCTVPRTSAQVIAPGATATVEVQFRLAGRRGRQRQVIQVVSDDPVAPRLPLTLEGVITLRIEANPFRIIAGNVDGQKGFFQDISLTAVEPFDILSLESSHPQVTVEDIVVTPGTHYLLRVQARPPFGLGQYQAEIRLTTNTEEAPEITIPVSFRVVGAVNYAPQVLLVPANARGPVTRFVVLQPSGQGPFQVLAVEAPRPEIQVTVAPMGRGYRIQLAQISPAADLEGAVVRIRTSLEEMPEITIPFQMN